MRVSLVVPPFLAGYSHYSRSPAVARSGTFYYPIWLAYGAAGLERAGHEVQLLDAVAQRLDDEPALAKIRSFNPDLIVVDIATPSSARNLAFARRTQEIATVAVGGVHVIAAPEEAAGMIRIMSDYDSALPELCSRLAESPEEINNPATALDGGPFVSDIYRRHLKTRDYFYACTRYPFVSILAARGCPYTCVFCHWPGTISGSRYRTRSPEDIAEEMLFVERMMPEVREIFFEDDTFNIDERVVADRCETMIRKGVRIPWSANVRPKASKEILALMKRAGCRLVLAGYESGDNRVLARVGKSTREEDLVAFAENTRKTGLMVHGCFILGLPGDTRETMGRTIDLALKLDPDTAQFYPYMPYPGTPGAHGWHGELAEAGRHSYGGADLPPEEVNRLCDRTRLRFYRRPRYIVRKALQSIGSPSEFIRNLKAFRTFLPAMRES